MNSPLFDISPYQSGVTRSYSTDWRDATESDPAWDTPDLELNLETKTDEPDGNALTEWQTESEFTITLESGQTIEVKFIPCLEGEHRMHQFDFIGPVSTTGFKSHFVLAVEAEEYPHPRDYAQASVQDLVARFEAVQQQQSKSKKRARPVADAEAQAPQRQGTDNDSSIQEPTMAENETSNSSHVKVEVVEELSPEEEADRQRLELRVERAVYQAGDALRELRDRRLYRNTHKSWEDYCQDRFGYTPRKAYYLISAADVIDHLSSCEQFVHTLPTKENQCRELAKLAPEQQPEAWIESISRTGGKKVPPASTVRSVVEEIKRRKVTPAPISHQSGDVLLIRCKSGLLKKYDSCWAIAIQINEYTIFVQVHDGDLVVQPENLEPIDSPSECEEVRAIAQRITRLRQCELLDQCADAVLSSLGRQTYLTEVAEGLLSWLENHYGVV